MIDPRRLPVRSLAAWSIVLCGFVAEAGADHVERVKDIYPGAESSNPVDLTELNGTVYFGAETEDLRAPFPASILWKSDGTEAGTSVVYTVVGASARGPISEVARAGDLLYFTSPGPLDGILVKSDGTQAGTSFVASFWCNGPCGGPRQLTSAGGFVYFTVATPEHGAELYRTDGTPAGTILVRDIVPGSDGSSPEGLVAFQGRVFFSATDGTTAPTLWMSDGTEYGTTPVVFAGDLPLNPTNLTVAGSRLYFAADGPNGRTLWASDGTWPGTRPLGPPSGPELLNPESLLAVGDRLYLSGISDFQGAELHLVDFPNVVRLGDIVPGADSSSPRDLVDVDGILHFSADDGVNGRELWTWDPNGFWPALASDIATGPASSNPRGGVAAGGRLFFVADGAEGAEIWRSDGTPAGTQLVQDVVPGPGSSNPAQLTAVPTVSGLRIFFTATTPAEGTELHILRNALPVAEAGPDVVVPPETMVTLDGSGSTDADGDVLTYLWQDPWGFTLGTSATVDVLPWETTTYTLTVRDGFGGVTTDTVTVTLDDSLQVSLSVEIDSVEYGSGAVHIDPPAVDCVNAPGSGQLCTQPYEAGTVVTLTATASASSVFVGWTAGECFGSSSPTCVVTMDQARATRATFRGPVPLTVEAASVENGSGAVHIDPPGVDCANGPGGSQLCTNPYRVGTVVQLTATASASSVFVGWTAGECFGSSSPTCVVTMDQARAARATFRGPVALSVEAASVENGSGAVRIDPPNVDCVNVAGSSQLCTNPYRVGTVVQLTATASADSVFVGWTAGECVNSSSPTCVVTMDKARATRATFRGPNVFTVTLVKSGTNAGSVVGSVAVAGGPTCSINGTAPVTCTYAVPVGTSVTLTATAGTTPTVFAGWTGCTSGTNVCTLTVQSGSAVVASFRRNQPPVPNAGGPYSGFRNQSIAFNATGSSDPDGDPLTYTWTFGDGSSATGPTPSHAYALPGTYQIFLMVNDGRTTTQALTVATVTNRAPVANAGGPYTGFRNVPISFNGSASSDPDGDSLTYLWTFGDGGTSTDANPAHAYASFGTFTVRLTVSDGVASSPQVTTQAVIVNRPPVANPGGPYTGARGVPVTFDGSGSVDPDGNPLTYSWNFGGQGFATGVAPTRVYNTLGSFSVFLVVNDGALSSNSQVATVTISHRAPLPDAGGPYSGTRLAPIAFSAAASSDPDGDPLTYAWSFGDGATATGANPSHAYATAGTFTATVTVSDAFGGSAIDTATVIVGPRIVHLTVSVNGTDGGEGSVSLSPPGGTCSTVNGVCQYDYNEGASVTLAATAAANSTFVGWSGGPCAGTGSCTVVLQADDAITASFAEGVPFTLTVAKAGTNPGAVFGSVAVPGGPTCSISGTAPFTCTYIRPVGATLTLTATTDNAFTVFAGWSGCASGTNVCTLVVQPGLSITASFRQDQFPVPNGGGPYTGFKNQPIAFDATGSTDPDGDPLTFSWSFGDGGSATGATPTHAYAAPGRYQIVLVVSDGAVSIQYFTFADVFNRKPVAVAGGPYSGLRGVPVAFVGSASSDADGDPLTYRWDFGDGVIGAGPTPSHTYSTFGSFTVTLVVNDGTEDSTPVFTQAVIPNRLPIANAGGPYSGVRGGAITFDGSGSVDPDGSPLTYQWYFGDGTTGSGVAPTHAYTTLGVFTATLIVSDGAQTSALSSANVTISNLGPIANAGADRTVPRKSVVTLDGRASSDPDGTIAAWAWRQLSGPAVTLTAANTSQPRFTAPNVTGNTPALLNFELKVTDNDGGTATDTVSITVVK